MDVIKNYGTKIPGLLLNGPCCKFYRKDIIDSYQIRFDSNISLGEDTLFVFEYLKYCENVFFVDYAGYVYYQIGTNSLMTKYRPDAYFSAKSVYQRLMIITRDICGGICPENMKLAYKNVLMVYIRKMIFNRNKVSREIIIKTIQNYIDDEVVQSCLRNQNKSVYSKLVDWLTEKKRGMCLELLLDVHVKFRGV